MLKNISISNKLVLMVSLPIIGLIYFTTTITLDKLATVNRINLLQELSTLAVKSSFLIHELQKERGISAGFIGSQGNKYSQELQVQRNLTDTTIKNLYSTNFNKSGFSDEMTNNFEVILAGLKVIEIKRNEIDKLEMTMEKEMSYYTNIIDDLLVSINQVSKVITNAKLYNKVVAYVNILQTKEKAGIERAILNNAFSQNEGYVTPTI
ncbi:nitrate- and nitrite sensing domain-containing protein, partial [Thiotrichales bacterium HSG1]|nr:nitrate- and nitrite sensing domain-containing protein [Thiotrichales bacterium HSG1]